MSQLAESAIRQITERLIPQLHPVAIYLFGSQSRGNANLHSDIDLLIVVDGPFSSGETRWELLKKARRSLSEIEYSKDLLVYSAAEFSKWKTTKNHIIETCVREGQLLYERA